LVADEFVVLFDGGGEFVGLGWYDPVTGVRLPISGEASETVTVFPLP